MSEHTPPPAKPGRSRQDAGPASSDEPRQRVLLVTGMSGAGKSSALKALEDMGYEAVDNLPISLLASLARPGQDFQRPLAIGIDVRTRDFGVAPFLQVIEDLIERPDVMLQLLFLDCDDEVLRRRFTETRRRHPLALDRPVSDGIRVERNRMAGLRERADAVVDTTDFTAADLGRWLRDHFSAEERPGLAVFVTSFAYGRGLPREADLVFDVRFLKNPHYHPRLNPLDGRDPAVGRFIEADPGFERFFDGLTGLLVPLIGRFEGEGKSYLTIAIGCTGGRHRSVYVAEKLAARLAEEGWRISVGHRDVGREREAVSGGIQEERMQGEEQ